jgi:uncharacterized protein (TIGR00730 family)
MVPADPHHEPEKQVENLVRTGPARTPVPDDPKARENLEKILASPTYVKAEEDLTYLSRPELRGVRLQLELNKTETLMQEQGVRSTIVVFGGTRIIERKDAEERLAAAERILAEKPGEPVAEKAVQAARRLLAKAPYYDEARRFGQLVSSTCQAGGFCDFVIMTGGGPGVMEASNRGAADVGAKSIGLNILLPHEQVPNAYITPSLCFLFHYFGIRKMHFLIRAKALVAFPGGFGTLDELFETLTLIQTGKMERVPVVLVGREFWTTLVNWQYLVDEGTIAAEDLDLFSYAETAEEAWKTIWDFYSHVGAPSAQAPKLR